MKPELRNKIPPIPNLSPVEAAKYVEFYSYLKYYDFGPYYVDDLVLEGIRLLTLDTVNCEMSNNKRPKLTDYINGYFHNGEIPFNQPKCFIWATYEAQNATGISTTYNPMVKESSLHEILERHGKKRGLDLFMGEEQAHFLHNNYHYLVNHCVLLPGNHIIESMGVINVKDLTTDDQKLMAFIKDKKNKPYTSRGEFSVWVKLSGATDTFGVYHKGESMLLYDLLQKQKVLMTSKPM